MRAFGSRNQPDRWRIVAAGLAAIILGGCGSVGGSSTSATPFSAAPTATAASSVRPYLPSGDLPAGTYTIPGVHGEPVDILLTVPDGWRGLDGVALLADDVSLSFWVVENLYVDPCHMSLGVLDPPPGPSVHDLASALAAQPLREATGPTPIEIDGYAGEMVTIHVPVGTDLTVCDDEEYGSWVGHGARGHGTPGERDEVRIVDVDGVRLVIDASTFPDSSEEEVAELQSIIDSIQLAPGS